MKKILCVLLVLLVVAMAMPVQKAEAKMSACELWAWSHFHPGFAMGCMIEIMSDFGRDWNSISPPGDADGTSG